MLLQPLCWCCVESAKNNTHIYRSPARGGLTCVGYRVGSGTRTALRAGWTCCGTGWVQFELAAGAGWTRVKKFFVWVNECWAKAHELNQLKNHKTHGCTEVVASIALKTVGPHQLAGAAEWVRARFLKFLQVWGGLKFCGCGVGADKKFQPTQDSNIYMVRTSNNRAIVVHDIYGCLLPQCEALHTCRSGFPITTVACPNCEILKEAQCKC